MWGQSFVTWEKFSKGLETGSGDYWGATWEAVTPSASHMSECRNALRNGNIRAFRKMVLEIAWLDGKIHWQMPFLLSSHAVLQWETGSSNFYLNLMSINTVFTRQ